MHTRRMNRKAFTLVELIIVIAIIAILSVSAFMVLTKWIGESRDSRRLSDVGTIERALSTYKADYKANPDGTLAVGNLPAKDVNNGTVSGTGIYHGDFDNDFLEAQPGFDVLQKVVKDPSQKNGDDIYYQIGIESQNQKKFSVAATLENGDNAETAAVRGNYAAGSEYEFASGANNTAIMTGTSLVPDYTKTATFGNGDFVEQDSEILPYSFE